MNSGFWVISITAALACPAVAAGPDAEAFEYQGGSSRVTGGDMRMGNGAAPVLRGHRGRVLYQDRKWNQSGASLPWPASHPNFDAAGKRSMIPAAD